MGCLCFILTFCLCYCTSIGFSDDPILEGQTPVVDEVTTKIPNDTPRVNGATDRPTDEVEVKRETVSAIESIHRELAEHSQRKQLLQREFERIRSNFVETDRDMESVRKESLRKQISMAFFQQRLSMNWSTLEREIDQLRANRPMGYFDPLRGAASRSLLDRQTRAFDITLDQNSVIATDLELSHLSVASQLIVRRRTQAFQDAAAWQRNSLVWLDERPMFFVRYWRFTDPNRIWTQAECEAMLSTFPTETEPDDYPAVIARALLEERLGYTDAALKSISKVLDNQTPLHFVALATRGIIYASSDEPTKARKDILAAYNADSENPYIRFLRARYHTLAAEWRLAETELNALLRFPDLELDSRRMLSVIYALGADRAPAYAFKAKQHAKLANGLSSESPWYGHLMMALALSVSDAPNEAIFYGQKSAYLASDEQKALADSITDTIRAGEPLSWDFNRK
ncbi:tetratricopeptide repeat protein [Novipirellula artificiosorum]|uniref:tetratricopeptide repeat protein n=1 Tax=Novipirellula artificiosorum TaxID=2528016 RepID=UPI0011B467E6|nr:hypothetical protein [Novipirellula artificiosorum]